MKRKVALIILFILLTVLTLCGCNGKSKDNDPSDASVKPENTLHGKGNEYTVDYCGDKSSFSNANDSYKAGEEVTLYYDIIASDTDYSFYLDDKHINAGYSAEKGYIIQFIMPDHNIRLRVDQKNSMEYIPEEPDLISLLLDESDADEEDVALFEQDDFDGDGVEEAFAIIGEISDEFEDIQLVDGEIWFAGSKGWEKLRDNSGMGFEASDRIMEMGSTDYVMFNDVYATGILTYVWYVNEGEAVETPFSGLGEVIDDSADEGQFSIMDSKYDAFFNPETSSSMGHTWKRYYFFYDESDKQIHEYAGTEIDEETAAYWCGSDIVKELIPARDQITDITCRGNSLVAINYEHIADGCVFYYHYIYNFAKKSLVDDTGRETGKEALEGTYLKALCPEIASYPQVPGPGDNVWYGE